MRILVLSNHYPPHSFGSYERQCDQICQELIGRGHQICVLTSKPPNRSLRLVPQAWVFRELELYDEEPAREPGFQRLFGIVRGNRRILERHLRTFLPEAIMVWGMERLPTSLLELIETSNIPCLYGVYDFWLAGARTNDPWGNYWNSDAAVDSAVARPLLRGLGLERFILKQAALGQIDSLQFDNVYFCSDSLKQETMRAGTLALHEAKIIPCAIAPGDFRARGGPRATQKLRIAYMARLSPEKDPLTAIRAIQELRHRSEDRFSLDIYGRGNLQFEASLHDYVRRFQLGGAISFKPISDDQVNTSIHLYDALVFTSRYPEPFPLVHLKAMASRVPVISTLMGGSEELIRDGENALGFQAGNHHELADRIARLADDPELTERLVDTAYTDVTENYTVQRVASRIESLLYGLAQAEGVLEQAR